MADEITLSRRPIKTRRLDDPSADEFANRATAAIEAVSGTEVEILGPTPDKAGTPFVVTHGLGAIPERVSMVDVGDYGGICYANPQDKQEWSNAHVVLRCTVNRETNMTVRLTRRPS